MTISLLIKLSSQISQIPNTMHEGNGVSTKTLGKEHFSLSKWLVQLWSSGPVLTFGKRPKMDRIQVNIKNSSQISSLYQFVCYVWKCWNLKVILSKFAVLNENWQNHWKYNKTARPLNDCQDCYSLWLSPEINHRVRIRHPCWSTFCAPPRFLSHYLKSKWQRLEVGVPSLQLD